MSTTTTTTTPTPTIQHLLTTYIHTTISIHKQRTQRLQQTNCIIKKQLSNINTSLNDLQKSQQQYNHEIDQMIVSLQVVDIIEQNVNKTCDNLGKIQQVLARLENKLQILTKSSSSKGSIMSK